ncbi:hypothetical protein Tco_0619470 [Tanacetum coccineum]
MTDKRGGGSSESIKAVMFYIANMDEDDEAHLMRDVKDMSRLQRKSVASGSNYFSWSESGKSVEVPSWMERLWVRNGSGTGVLLALVKPRRRRNNKPMRNNSGGRMRSSLGY